MRYYFAPMEGITGYIYRNAHAAHYAQIDKYFTPFIVPNQNRRFSSRELNDILPDHNQGLSVIPQILTNRADDFIWAAKEIAHLGYKEINLNLGCPSGTVVSKKKGSGFLAEQEKLNLFLETIFSELSIKISIKTRIGKDSPDEFYELIKIFNRYPLAELIIHPRIQKDFYKNQPNLEVFRDALSLSSNPVCYNGDIFTTHDYEKFITSYPEVNMVMLGRGLVGNPGLINQIRHGTPLDKQMLKEFHDSVYRGYQETLSGERNVLFRMKELWFYMLSMFTDNNKYGKKIRKAESLANYETTVSNLFREQEIVVKKQLLI